MSKTVSELCAPIHPWPSLVPKSGMILFMLFLLGLLFMLDIALGSVSIPLKSVVAILFGSDQEPVVWKKIVTMIRLPKAITAVIAGAALSVSGLQMQTLFRNPLAGPSVLGISAGASLGVAVVMLAGGGAANAFAIRQLGLGGSWLVVLAATVGAMSVMLVVLAVAVRIKDNVVLLIVGIMLAKATKLAQGEADLSSRVVPLDPRWLVTLAAGLGYSPAITGQLADLRLVRNMAEIVPFGRDEPLYPAIANAGHRACCQWLSDTPLTFVLFEMEGQAVVWE